MQSGRCARSEILEERRRRPTVLMRSRCRMQSPAGALILILMISALTGLISTRAPSAELEESGRPEFETPDVGDGAESLEEEQTGPIVARLSWSGVEAFETTDLEKRILTSARSRFSLRFWKPKPRLDEFELEEDLMRIEEAYSEIGFFSARATAHVEKLRDDRVAVAFEIEEGLLVRLRDWTLSIDESPDVGVRLSAEENARLRSHVMFEPDQAFGSKLYQERRSALLEECGEMGFPSARIEGGAEVDPVLGIALVDWTLHPGPRTRFGEIRVVGLEGVEEKIVRRELRFEEGDRFATSSLRKSERRLMATGLFRSVTIARQTQEEADPESSREFLGVEIRLEEAPPRSLRGTVGYGTEDGPRVGASVTWRNFLGEARRLRMRAFASMLDSGFVGSLGQPYVLGGGARGDLALSALRQNRPGYEAFVTGASGLLTFYPDREGPWSLTLGPGYEYARITHFAIDVGKPLRGPRDSVIVNWFSIARFEKVDDVIDPRSGLRAELGNELGGYPIGSELDYQRWNLSLQLYHPTGPFVWAASVKATTLDPLAGVLSDVPLTRRLYSGGTTSVRGYGFQKLGPTDSGNDPIGGLSRMELGVELRLPIWRSLGLVGFVDAGDVRSDSWSWRPGDLRASAGPGLRFHTPVGPLRFDVGFPLNPPDSTDKWRIHLSVGHAF